MAVFVEIEEDPWATNAEDLKEVLNQGAISEFAVRRPTRGIEVHEPTYSFMRIVDRFGQPVLMLNSSDASGLGVGYYTSNYLLQSLTYSRSEKMQIVETFGENYIFMFGERPIQAQITGGLVHSPDFTWPVEFWRNYQDSMRGTRLAELGARLYLYVDGMLLEGLAVGANDNRVSDQPNIVPFNMQLLVTNIQFLNEPAVDFPIRRTAVQDVSILKGVDGWQRLMTMSQAERSQYLATEYGVQSRQVKQARAKQQRSASAASGLCLLFESATQGPQSALMFSDIIDPSFLDELDPPSRSTSLAGYKRRTPLRSRIIDNLDEYVQGAPKQGSPSPELEDEGMDQATGAGEAGLSPALSTYSSFSEDPPGPPGPDEAATTLPEVVGADPGADVSSGSGVLTGRDLPPGVEGPSFWA